jgi:hypothetical protein
LDSEFGRVRPADGHVCVSHVFGRCPFGAARCGHCTVNSLPDERLDIALPSDAARQSVSIVIVSWNEWPKLEQCLTSIYNDTPVAIEVLVIDNGSADGTPELVRERFPNVGLHCNMRNLGRPRRSISASPVLAANSSSSSMPIRSCCRAA